MFLQLVVALALFGAVSGFYNTGTATTQFRTTEREPTYEATSEAITKTLPHNGPDGTSEATSEATTPTRESRGLTPEDCGKGEYLWQGECIHCPPNHSDCIMSDHYHWHYMNAGVSVTVSTGLLALVTALFIFME